MREKRILPMTMIVITVLVLGGVWYWFTLMTQSTEGEQYASQPIGWNSPAGKCVVCHSLEKDGSARVAPSLWGIVGSSKGGAKGYGYSLALAKAGGVWTEQDLDEYLTAPSRFLPGTSKTITGLPNDQERAKVIAYLGTLKD